MIRLSRRDHNAARRLLSIDRALSGSDFVRAQVGGNQLFKSNEFIIRAATEVSFDRLFGYGAIRTCHVENFADRRPSGSFFITLMAHPTGNALSLILMKSRLPCGATCIRPYSWNSRLSFVSQRSVSEFSVLQGCRPEQSTYES